MSPQSLLVFVMAGLLLNLTPGPDVLYIVANALRSGVRAGVMAALGITAGCLVHVLAAALGVSALMAASVTAFTVLKWAGAAYLVYVGIGMLFRKAAAPLPWASLPSGGTPLHGERMRSVFWRGFATNALNPKVALFFLAFLPQFIEPGIAHPSLAFLGLGLLFTFNGMWVNMAWAWAAATLAGKSARLQSAVRWLDRIAGVMFVTFGVRLALADNPST